MERCDDKCTQGGLGKVVRFCITGLYSSIQYTYSKFRMYGLMEKSNCSAKLLLPSRRGPVARRKNPIGDKAKCNHTLVLLCSTYGLFLSLIL